MGKVLKHKTVGNQLTQTEFEAEDSHEYLSGTSFPSDPSVGDYFIRTDLGNELFFWNGESWEGVRKQEKSFSSWSKQWDTTPPNSLQSGTEPSVFFGENFVQIWYTDSSYNWRIASFYLSNGSVKSSSTAGTDYTASAPSVNATGHVPFSSVNKYGATFSNQGRYGVYIRSGEDTFSVWKDGSEQWTSSSASSYVTGATKFIVIAMNINGEYILAVTDNGYLVLFKGG